MSDLTERIEASVWRQRYQKKRLKCSTQNKYRNCTGRYDGRFYSSQLEIQIAKLLDHLKQSGVIRKWWPQEKFPLPAKTKKGRIKSHRVDFKIQMVSGDIVYVEAKGKPTADGETRRQWVEHEHGIKIHVVRSVKQAMDVLSKMIQSD